MGVPALYDDKQWPYVLTLLPSDLEDSAKQTGAILRCRNIPNAAGLLRMALAYGVSDLSLKDVAAWAHALGLAEISGPGLFYRLRGAEAWLERVLAETLQDTLGPAPQGVRLRIVDATVINGPASIGTDWRAHVLTDPASGGFRSVEITDNKGGEGYARHPVQAGEVVLGDRVYGTARGIHAVRSVQAHVVVRINPQIIRLCNLNRERIELRRYGRRVPQVGVVEFSILIPIPPDRRPRNSRKTWRLGKAKDWVSARIVAARTRPGRIIWVLTTIPAAEMAAVQILELYRLRWHIELLFKRLKSLLHLDQLPSRQGPTAKSWMLARLLAAALAHRLVQPSGPLSPWGYQLRSARLHP
jgi:Transposase DDE domain